MTDPQPQTRALQGAAPLHDLGVIRVAGDDAASFLHGQLTQDFALLDEHHARLTALLNPKGRMLASFVGLKRSATEVLLVCPRDVLPAALRRLSMFVLRAKAKLSDASAEFQLYGLAGDAARALLPGDAAPWTLARAGEASVVALYPADGQPRALWLAPASTPAPDAPPLDTALWHWSEVCSGVATLTAPVVEAFVPQMLNYESVGGVSFKKGCYPGQEVVARSQFRGAIKRRAYLVHAPAALPVGTELFAQGDDEQPVGLVVQCAAHPAGGFDALVSMQIAAAGKPLVAGGQPLQVGALPYALLEDI